MSVPLPPPPPPPPTRRPHHGLTLLEVLIATAILAVMASAVVPSIAQALDVLRQLDSKTSVDRADLASVVDAFMLDPKRLGVDIPPARLHEINDTRITWPTDEPRYEKYAGVLIEIRSIALGGAEVGAKGGAEHLWLEFTCERLQVIRWVSIPSKIKTEAREPS